MTAGEFSRKLKTAINDAGYTSNNVIITGICIEKRSFIVQLEDTKENAITLYIEED